MPGSQGRTAIRVALTVAVLLAPTVLSGCGGGPPPRALPRLSTDQAGGSQPLASTHGSPTTSHSRSERASVTTVVRRYYRVVNRLSRDMNADALAALFTGRCPCQAQVHAVRVAAAKAEHYVGTAHLNVVRPSVEGPNRASVLVNVDISRSGLVTSGGTMVTSTSARHGVQRIFRLEKVRRGWLVYRIDAA